MSAPAERAPTFEELYQAIEALPEGLTGEILEPGMIRTMGRPGAAHRFAASRIARSFGDDEAAQGGSWWLEQEAEIRLLGERLAVPDMSGWRLGPDEAVPPPFIRENPIVRTPTWCCEILSPTTEATDRETKVPLYARAGVEWIWLVDPSERCVEVLRAREGVAQLLERVAGDAQGAIPPFDSVLQVSGWWLPEP